MAASIPILNKNISNLGFISFKLYIFRKSLLGCDFQEPNLYYYIVHIAISIKRVLRLQSFPISICFLFDHNLYHKLLTFFLFLGKTSVERQKEERLVKKQLKLKE